MLRRYKSPPRIIRTPRCATRNPPRTPHEMLRTSTMNCSAETAIESTVRSWRTNALKSTPSRFMGENNSALETSGDGLASDLDEIDRPIETDGEVVAYRDVECKSRLIATREPPHRGFEQRSPEPAPAAVLRDAELGDERHAPPVRDQDRAHDPVALQRNVGRVRHELTGIAFEEPGHIAAPLPPGPRMA